MDLTQEEVIYRTRRRLGRYFEVLWKNHALLRMHCGQRMAVLAVRRRGDTTKGQTVLACGAHNCDYTEPKLSELQHKSFQAALSVERGLSVHECEADGAVPLGGKRVVLFSLKKPSCLSLLRGEPRSDWNT